jgi:hypothetical protein
MKKLLVVNGKVKCFTCGEWKPISDFQKRKTSVLNFNKDFTMTILFLYLLGEQVTFGTYNRFAENAIKKNGLSQLTIDPLTLENTLKK